MTNDYGEAKARDILMKLELARKEVAKRKPKPLVTRKKRAINAPNLDWSPMSQAKMPGHIIDWDDVITDSVSSDLASKFAQDMMLGPSTAQILKMGTGLGKTAIAVKTAGSMQSKLGKTLPIIVATTSKVASGGGWQSTILSWNKAHPDNEIVPLLITTHDKLASACKHGETLKRIINGLDPDSLVILDEVHKFKNPVSKRSKQLQKLKMFRKLGLSATPIGNDPILDIASYLIMAGFYENKTRFSAALGLNDPGYYGKHGACNLYVKGGIDTDRWPQYFTMLDQFAMILSNPKVDMSHVKLPSVTTTVNYLPFDIGTYLDIASLNDAQRKRLFPSSTDYMLAVIERLGMESGRKQKMLDIVLNPATVQPLIFYTHNNVKTSIEESLSSQGIDYQLVAGGTDFSKIDIMSDGPIIMQYQAGGEGVELKHSNCSIFYENQYSYLSLKQAQGRNKRRASKNDHVDHHYLVSEHGIDKEIFQRVINREELSNKIVLEIIEKQSELDA